jgi:hypothetical protein
MSEKGIIKFTYSVVCAQSQCSNEGAGESSSIVMTKRVLSLNGWKEIIGTGWICPECGKLHQEPPSLLV